MLNKALAFYSWTATAIIAFILFLIARFYERKSGERSYYQLFLLPSLSFLLAAWRYLLVNEPWGDTVGDGALTVGGFSLIFLSYFLARLMMGKR